MASAPQRILNYNKIISHHMEKMEAGLKGLCIQEDFIFIYDLRLVIL